MAARTLNRQVPIGSGFGASTTTNEVIRGYDLSGKTAIVTGGYSGLGLETTRALSSAGAKVVVLARNRDSAATALHALEEVEVEAMDLLDPASVDASGLSPPAGRCTRWWTARGSWQRP
jgi:NADP-dependent 3-hydroxy acid dehydrogenase YdfG